MRSLVPTTRNPAARCRARLAVFSGKIGEAIKSPNEISSLRRLAVEAKFDI